MAEAGALALLVAIYGGLALLALALVGIASALARGRAAVVTCTVVASLLVGLHFAFVLFAVLHPATRRGCGVGA